MGYVSHVHAERIADCPFSMAQEYIEDYFRAAQSGGEEAQIRIQWALGLLQPIVRRVDVSFGLRSDRADQGRAHDEILVRWSTRSRLLPNFHGTIRVRIAQQRTRVLIEGEYVPPGGPLGAVFDVLIGRWIARASLDDLAVRLAARLGQDETRAARRDG